MVDTPGAVTFEAHESQKNQEKVVIHSRKQIYEDLGNLNFVSSMYTDPKTVYIPMGELYGVKILMKVKIKEDGRYFLLDDNNL